MLCFSQNYVSHISNHENKSRVTNFVYLVLTLFRNGDDGSNSLIFDIINLMGNILAGAYECAKPSTPTVNHGLQLATEETR